MLFTFHARKRTRLRRITERDIAAVLDAPAHTTTVRPGATNYHGCAVDGRAIVVVTADDMQGLIITVMIDHAEEPG